ncbi:putative nuclear RNA export factor SDE5 [Candidatus Saccharibacteria bacterium]|nr:putative nuclear RNA export factor SDE5 [Candidatus Saccharibacteria bacterium]
MSRNGELDSLKAKEQEAFRQKQAAYQRYDEAKKLTNSAYINMQSAWNDRCSAREVMNSEYAAMQASNSNYREVWAEYSRIRDGNNTRIQQLRSDSDHEHRMMQDCFERASFAYTSGDKAEASSLSAEGRSHKERRDSINAEVSSLCYEIRSAKMNAESRAPKTDGSAFRSAKSAFNEAKSCHESAQAEFNRLKAERDRLKAEFDTAQKRFLQYKEEFQKRLAEVKAKNQQERDRILDKAGITGAERADAKIVKKADGTIQVYHGGFGPGDGFGHGHTAIDQSGVITYDRDAFESHGAQNYTDHEARSLEPDKPHDTRSTNPGARKTNGGWTPIQKGTIFDENDSFDVTFREGLGNNDGQTLISDGHVSRKNFDQYHNHYGNNDKRRFPNEPDRIEDSSKHRNDHYYNGPGH